ncbi:hypothetical protein G6709_03890 [Polynucleobacter paneuropaeus]|nr:hypothetical protein [Polynucleobacter paneuropaeus]
MLWDKKGLIFSPNGTLGWQNQFAMLPTPLLVDNDRLRIFLGFCDENMVGRIGYVDVQPDNPSNVISVSPRPVLDIGEPSSFDDHGVVPTSIFRQNNKIYLFYVGFQLRLDVPYTMFCGLATSIDNGNSFIRTGVGPLLQPTKDEPYARCGVHVLSERNRYHMWYVGSIGKGWVNGEEGKILPNYSMKYMSSGALDFWGCGSPSAALNFESADEYGFGRPFVWRSDGRYKMLYSIRTFSRGYQIGYAESIDGIGWERKDSESGLMPGGNGWESDSVSYPHLFTYGEKTFVFYNGNGCGRTGVGYAELVK